MSEKEKYLAEKFILPPDKDVNGLGYEQLIQRFQRNLCSENPDGYDKYSGCLFLRGSPSDVSYLGTKGVPGSLVRIGSEETTLNRREFVSHVITQKDIVFVCVLNSFFSADGKYYGKTLNSIEDAYRAVREDMAESPYIYLKVFSPGTSPDRHNGYIVRDLKTRFCFLTQPFHLKVPKGSRLAKYLELIEDIDYDNMVVGGHFVGFTNLDEGRWEFHFGGVGKNAYTTNSQYLIEVNNNPDLPVDISGENFKDKEIFRRIPGKAVSTRK
jgi:hypothetical protein